MKTRILIIIVILTLIIYLNINTALAQVAPVSGLPVALFKTDNNVYEIQYYLTNGNLVSSLVDLSARELIFIFNATDDGQLTVVLPREIIDSKRDGKDKPYLVFVGDINSGLKRTNASEIQNDNETRTFTINFAEEENEIGIVGTYFIENKSPYVPINPFGTFSPLMQFKKGIDAQDVICRENLVLIQKHNGSPVCVKPETKQKLIERGWSIG